MGIEFIRDCLSRSMSMLDIAIKYDIDIEEVLPTYMTYKETCTQEELDNIMKEVYYGFSEEV